MGVNPTKSKKYCLFITGFLFSLLSGCGVLAPFESSLSEWEGHPVSELIDSWGEPDRSSSLGSDTVALTWAEQDGLCEYTFIAREGRVTGYSESGC